MTARAFANLRAVLYVNNSLSGHVAVLLLDLATHYMQSAKLCIPYGGKLWQEENLANHLLNHLWRELLYGAHPIYNNYILITCKNSYVAMRYSLIVSREV